MNLLVVLLANDFENSDSLSAPVERKWANASHYLAKINYLLFKATTCKKGKLSNRRSCRRHAVTATAIADRHGHMRMHAAFNIDRENRTHCNPML